jgi:DUF4097 and DUF4098 domain-containing protein YvlB
MAMEKWLIDGEKVIDLDGVRKLKVGLVAGQVNIIGHDEPGARVEVHSVKGRELKVTIDGDTLEIDHPQIRWDDFVEVFKSFTDSRARADISITVPRDVALTFGVVSASGLISGLVGDATISTVSGDLVIDNITGDLRLNSVNGEIAVRNHTGAITAHGVTGDITLAGAITALTADTVSGDVFADISGAPEAIRVNTVTGNVTTRLAADVPARYTINTVGGRLQLDDVTVSGVRGPYTGKFGSLDEAWVEFRANTVSGNVSVLHAVTT